MNDEYVLTLNSDQAKEILKAVELLMRLKIGQYQEITFNLADKYNPEKFQHIEMADYFLKKAFDEIYYGKPQNEYKDDEWYRLYNIYQVLRYNIHNAETPGRDGIDGQPPMKLTKEPLPVCEWRMNNG